MKRHSVALFILIVGGTAVSWLLVDSSKPDLTPQMMTDNTPDAFAEQLTILSFDTLGHLHYRLQTPKMRFFEAKDTTELDHPKLWQFNLESPTWKVRGERALLFEEGESIFMPGPVTIDREGSDHTTPFYRINTRDLKMQTATAYAETDQAIEIDSPGHRITAVGMQGWLQEPVRIKLLNKVRGYYERL